MFLCAGFGRRMKNKNEKYQFFITENSICEQTSSPNLSTAELTS